MSDREECMDRITLGELEKVKATPKNFAALLRWFSDLSEEDKVASFEDTLHILSRWEDKDRVVRLEEIWPTYPKEAPRTEALLVRCLDLERAGVTSQLLEACLTHKALASLTHLRMGWSGSDVEVLRFFVDCAHSLALKTLNLVCNPIENDGLITLASARSLPNLECLLLNRADIGDSGVVALARSPHFPKLKTLSLHGNDISSEGAVTLAQSPHFPRLEGLDISVNPIGKQGARTFLETKAFPALRELRVDLQILDAAMARSFALGDKILPVERASFLRKSNVSELKELADSLDVSYNSKTKKSELIEALLAAHDAQPRSIDEDALGREHTRHAPAQEAFAELRELLSKTPSAKIFATILQLANTWDMLDIREEGLAYADAHLQSWDPALRHAEMRDVWPSFPKGKPLHCFQLVRSVRWPIEKVAPGAFEGLAHLRQIEFFHFGRAHCPKKERAHTIESFLSSPHIKQLRQLRITELPLGKQRTEIFDALDECRSLESFALIECALKKKDIVRLAKSIWFRRLRKIFLYRNELGGDGLVRLLNALDSEKLEELRVMSNFLGDGAVEAFGNRTFSSLKVLDLSFNQLDQEAAIAIAEGASFPSLESLSLDGNSIRRFGLEAWLDAGHFHHLRRLTLSACELDPGAAELLATSSALSALQTLFLHYNKLTDKGVIALSKAASLSSLQTLNLSSTSMHDEGVFAILESELFPSLRKLICREVLFSEEGYTRLAETPALARFDARDISGQDYGDSKERCMALGMSPYVEQSLRLEFLQMLTKENLVQLAKQYKLPSYTKKSKEALTKELSAL
ncbi:MAG: hypothetical protein CL920_10755 [Deltaproteobacteria bacterium]|nr:hypothetical protein [Deltaproteobacteria bacterium]MBU49166.1 hypothetical protein [Deltaproteobacteria bacterium]